MVTAVKGRVAPGYEPVRAAFAATLDRFEEGGAAFCAYVEGREMVHIWSGEAAPGRPWDSATLTCGFSTAKGLVALAVQVLCDRREIDVEDSLARFWPQFATQGKDRVNVRHVLTHTAGLPWFPNHQDVVSLDDPSSFLDLERIETALAAAPLVWEPGVQAGYHSITMGWLIGVLVHRVSGLTLGTFLRREVAEPLGLDYWLGTPPTVQSRVAPTAPDPAMDGDEVHALYNAQTPLGKCTMVGPRLRLGQAIGRATRDVAFQSAEVPSANANTDARSLSRLYGLLACSGELDGVRLVSEASIAEHTAEQVHSRDVFSQQPLRVGLGFRRPLPDGPPMGPHDAAFGHPGLGGSIAFADPVARVGLCYLTNRLVLGPDTRAQALVDSLYACVGTPIDLSI
jgi:CubicO group peptidase (beta-lactamase class C family)